MPDQIRSKELPGAQYEKPDKRFIPRPGEGTEERALGEMVDEKLKLLGAKQDEGEPMPSSLSGTVVLGPDEKPEVDQKDEVFPMDRNKSDRKEFLRGNLYKGDINAKQIEGQL